MRREFGLGTFILTRILITLVIILILFPLIWMISLSFRDERNIYEAYGYIIPKEPTLENYPHAVSYVEDSLNLSFLRMFANSAIATFSAIAIALFLAILAAYGFAFFRFRGRGPVFNLILLSLLVPVQVILIPLFFMFARMNIDNLPALILIYAANSIPISLLILRGFFEQLPEELRDASKIDGASDFQYLIRVVIPLSKPAIASVIVFLFLALWNEFLLAKIFIPTGPWQTLPEAISKIGSGLYVVPWGVYSASVVIGALPVIVLFTIFQRWFIEGITLGALKG